MFFKFSISQNQSLVFLHVGLRHRAAVPSPADPWGVGCPCGHLYAAQLEPLPSHQVSARSGVDVGHSYCQWQDGDCGA